MARVADRLPENAAGDLFVDRTCIDCDTCRQIAPSVFARSKRRGLSFVETQPATEAERMRAHMALVSCPTSSIGSVSHAAVADAVRAFPENVEANVYYCGFTAADSFGASSYLIVRPEGNVLVDSPRATEPLMRAVEAMGGVRLMLLTHIDDVADHRQWRARFGCTRVIHEADAGRGLGGVEHVLRGTEPERLAGDLLAIPVPGHTAGSTSFLYGDRFLFTGDHLWWSPHYDRLHASRGVCWHSWPEQLASVRRLLDHRFQWVLPGHGRRYHAASADAMRAEIERALGDLE
jgi:glyoxylase-like metal-dependent hydrolase (beta-lactamase superfamily II)/ferredoxin